MRLVHLRCPFDIFDLPAESGWQGAADLRKQDDVKQIHIYCDSVRIYCGKSFIAFLYPMKSEPGIRNIRCTESCGYHIFIHRVSYRVTFGVVITGVVITDEVIIGVVINRSHAKRELVLGDINFPVDCSQEPPQP